MNTGSTERRPQDGTQFTSSCLHGHDDLAGFGCRICLLVSSYFQFRVWWFVNHYITLLGFSDYSLSLSKSFNPCSSAIFWHGLKRPLKKLDGRQLGWSGCCIKCCQGNWFRISLRERLPLYLLKYILAYRLHKISVVQNPTLKKKIFFCVCSRTRLFIIFSKILWEQ